MNVGTTFDPLLKEEITHTQIVRYAGASGDFNPIHTVVPYAEKAGLDGVIAHGLMIKGFIGQAIKNWFPDHELIRFSSRFKAMTWPGERIKVSGYVIEETEDRWICKATAENLDGEEKAGATFEILRQKS